MCLDSISTTATKGILSENVSLYLTGLPKGNKGRHCTDPWPTESKICLLLLQTITMSCRHVCSCLQASADMFVLVCPLDSHHLTGVALRPASSMVLFLITLQIQKKSCRRIKSWRSFALRNNSICLMYTQRKYGVFRFIIM